MAINPELRSRLVWMALTSVGLALGLLVMVIADEPLEALIGAMLLLPVFALLTGASVGAAQSLGLGSIAALRSRWLPATTVGLAFGLIAGVVGVELASNWLAGERVRLLELPAWQRALSFCALGIIAGGVLGAAQSFALRRRMPRRMAWIASCAAALALAFVLSSLAVDAVFGGLGSGLGIAVFAPLSGALFGLLTGRPSLDGVPKAH